MTMARRIKVSTMSLVVLLMIASFYETSAESAGGDELGLFREWLTRGRLSPSTSVALSSTSSEADVDDDDDVEMTSSSESSLGRDSSANDDQRLLYLLADEENNGGRRTSGRRDDVILRAWADWLQQNRGSSDVKASASKRSPSCMRKCLSQGYLHPAQCHSLC